MPATASPDQAFERLLLAFRDELLHALAYEPAGPARHLRAYLRSVCDDALRRPRGRRLLMQPQNQAVWLDFVEEACAHDGVAADLSLYCRATVQGLWLTQSAGARFTRQHVLTVRDSLLHLCDAAESPARASPSAAHALPHCAVE